MSRFVWAGTLAALLLAGCTSAPPPITSAQVSGLQGAPYLTSTPTR